MRVPLQSRRPVWRSRARPRRLRAAPTEPRERLARRAQVTRHRQRSVGHVAFVLDCGEARGAELLAAHGWDEPAAINAHHAAAAAAAAAGATARAAPPAAAAAAAPASGAVRSPAAQCIVCFEEMPPAAQRLVQLPCGHATCAACWKARPHPAGGRAGGPAPAVLLAQLCGGTYVSCPSGSLGRSPLAAGACGGRPGEPRSEGGIARGRATDGGRAPFGVGHPARAPGRRRRRPRGLPGAGLRRAAAGVGSGRAAGSRGRAALGAPAGAGVRGRQPAPALVRPPPGLVLGIRV